MYHPTTALKKISKLNKPTRILQGSQGAGKTIGVLMLFINHCQHNKDKELTVLQGELSKAKKTVLRDFIKIMKANGFFERHRWNKSESIYTFPTGSYM